MASVCSVCMWVLPGLETVPYHLAWIALALSYGFEAWPRGRTTAAIALFTTVTGAILVGRAATGVIAWDETTEIPLMTTLMVLVVWHVRRRHTALAAMSDMAAAERRRAAQRERLSRMTSHEMRTPTTIAMGYAELLLSDEKDPHRREDLAVVVDELERIALTSDRLVRMLWIPEQDDLETVDMDAMLLAIADRWSVAANRDWQVTSAASVQWCSPGRMRACLDTLIENAVRYTGPGDVVRLVSWVRDGVLAVGVADSGPGFDDDLRRSVNAAADLDLGESAADPKRQTGLGLGLVREAVGTRGGSVTVGVSPEGGALVLMLIPVGHTRQDQPPVAPCAGSVLRVLGDPTGAAI